MGEQQTGECPLCDNSATYGFADHKNIRTYQCEKCGCFGMSRRAEEFVREKGENIRSQLSAMTRNAPDGQYLRMTYTLTQEGIQLVTEYASHL